MTDYKTGAIRDTGGKGRMDLLPWSSLIRISKHVENAILPDPETGTPHYPERNWEKGLPMHSMIDSAFRHLAKYVDGWDDEDHLCAAATNLLMAMWMEEHRPDMQDIPSRCLLSSSLYQKSEEAREPVEAPSVQEKVKEISSVCPDYISMSGSPRCRKRNMIRCSYSDDFTKCIHRSDIPKED